MIKNRIFNKIVSIVLAVFTVVLGSLFILQSIRLNNHYTKELVIRVLMQIIVVIVLWALVFVLSLFTKPEESKRPQRFRYFRKTVSDVTYMFINIGYLVIVLICAGFTIAYLVQKKHYSYEFNSDMLAIVYYLLPFVTVLLVASLVRAAFVVAPKRKEMMPIDKKQTIMINIVRTSVLVLAITLVVIGAINKQADIVLKKAVMICLECIGIG